MIGLSLSLLGSFMASLDGRPLRKFRTNRVQALLIFLATEKTLGERFHRREALMDLLWPGLPQQSAQVNLRQAIYHLRKAVPDLSPTPETAPVSFLLSDRNTVQINPAFPQRLDVAGFQRLVAGTWEQRAEAVELYRGDFLADFYLPHTETFEEWAAARRAAFQRQVLVALDALASGWLDRGDFDKAEGYARRALAMDNLRESAYRQLMQALARSGRRSEALVTYNSGRQQLQTELGATPSAETLALYEAILAGDIDATTTPTPIEPGEPDLPKPLHSVTPEALYPIAPAHNLPPQPTPFVGREAELAALATMIADPEVRLITVVGSGGMGKTRLALAAAERQFNPPTDLEQGESAPPFPHGVYFVPLAPLSVAEHIVPAIVEALDVRLEGAGRQTHSLTEQLLDYLRRKRLLLVMDNFEHLLDGADTLADLLQAAPSIKVLATSRERLNLRSEQLYPIQGLEFMAADTAETSTAAVELTEYAAAKLFLQSARRNQPDFELAAEEVNHLNRICRLVEGMPLGLELAASWVDSLSLADIAIEIQAGLDFLETEARDVPRRQRSMRAVFDSTWQRLAEKEGEAFAQMSVFRGGFSRPAAEAVARATVKLLARLVSRSLLQYDKSADRYQIHELLRQYGADRLAENPSVKVQARHRHSTYYAAWLDQKESDLHGAKQQAALAQMEIEAENARAAWSWSVDQREVRQLERAMDGLGHFYELRGRYQEGEQTFRIAVAALRRLHLSQGRIPTARPSGEQRAILEAKVLVKALAWRGVFLSIQGSAEQANRLLEESLALLDSPELADQDVRPEKAFVLLRKGWLNRDLEPADAEQMVEESLTLYRALGDRWTESQALFVLGHLAQFAVDYQKAKLWIEESLVVRQALGDRRGIAESLSKLASIAGLLGDFIDNERLARESHVLRQEIGDRAIVAFGLNRLGEVLRTGGHFAESQDVVLESIALFEELGDTEHLANSYMQLGWSMLHLGKYEQAYEQFDKSVALYRQLGPLAPPEMPLFKGFAAISIGAYEEAYQLAQESTAVIKKFHLTLGLTMRGIAAHRLGNTTEAQYCILKSLQIGSEIRSVLQISWVLAATALLLADEGEAGRAVELYSLLTKQMPWIASSRWYYDFAGRFIESAATSLPAEVVAAAQARGRSLDLWQAVDDLLRVLQELGWSEGNGDSTGEPPLAT